MAEIDTLLAVGVGAAYERLKALQRLIEEQAKDPGLWLVADQPTPQEVYLQQELRKLHRAIEALEKIELG